MSFSHFSVYSASIQSWWQHWAPLWPFWPLTDNFWCSLIFHHTMAVKNNKLVRLYSVVELCGFCGVDVQTLHTYKFCGTMLSERVVMGLSGKTSYAAAPISPKFPLFFRMPYFILSSIRKWTAEIINNNDNNLCTYIIILNFKSVGNTLC